MNNDFERLVELLSLADVELRAIYAKEAAQREKTVSFATQPKTDSILKHNRRSSSPLYPLSSPLAPGRIKLVRKPSLPSPHEPSTERAPASETCFYCKKPGHFKSSCPEFTAKQIGEISLEDLESDQTKNF